MYSIAREHGNVVLNIRASGAWTPEEVDRYYVELEDHLRSIRRERGSSKILVDAVELPVQPQDFATRMARFEVFAIQCPGDRCAVIVGSSLAKMHMSRIMTSDQAKVFLSANAAKTWLLAYT